MARQQTLKSPKPTSIKPGALPFKVEVQLAGMTVETVRFASRDEAVEYARSFDTTWRTATELTNGHGQAGP